MILTLPFSIMLPRTIQGAQSKLPETFLERHTRSSIQYDFTIIIERHGGMLKNDSKCVSIHSCCQIQRALNELYRIKTAFGYVPSIRTETPTSLMRQLAYTQHAAVPGPRADPDPNAWTLVMPAVSNIGGKLKGKGAVNVQCELALATPVCSLFSLATTFNTDVMCSCRTREEASSLLTSGYPLPQEAKLRWIF